MGPYGCSRLQLDYSATSFVFSNLFYRLEYSFVLCRLFFIVLFSKFTLTVCVQYIMFILAVLFIAQFWVTFLE